MSVKNNLLNAVTHNFLTICTVAFLHNRVHCLLQHGFKTSIRVTSLFASSPFLTFFFSLSSLCLPEVGRPLSFSVKWLTKKKGGLWTLINNTITAQFFMEKKKKRERFQIVSSALCAESKRKGVKVSGLGFVRAVCRTDWDEIQDVIGLFHDFNWVN